ncbi:MAG: 50S ribosomal protein L32 [Planctomycetes bacterium]|nr:50S ribosomal protein L32 [Planctomycetota bacterium]
MGVPKRKTSKSRRGMRRSHDGVRLIDLVKCSRCGNPKLPHTICEVCGFYRGKSVVPKEEI